MTVVAWLEQVVAMGTDRESIESARRLFPATEKLSYFNTAAVSLGSTILRDAYTNFVAEWTENGLNTTRAEQAGENARRSFAKIIGARAENIALIPSVSAAAGLIASQFGIAERGENVVIGEREYSSNHFPWRMLERKGYDIRQTPFRNGGLEPDDIAQRTDGGTILIAYSAVQSASGHRSDILGIADIAKQAGAMTFVDGSQMAGALPVAPYLDSIDVFATSDHKFLLNAVRGVGYCYIRKSLQRRLVPTNAGWKAGAVPLESFFGPEMRLSQTASRFDNSLNWLAAIGDEAALSLFDRFGIDTVFNRNAELVNLLRDRLAEIGQQPISLPPVNQSTIVAIPLDDTDPTTLLKHLKARDVVCRARDGNLRLAVHFYNNADDIDRLVGALKSC
ncbi:MAG: aminotransferase class V-fold PLP-dependent enzyme [Gammaproteobacteria bacterium]|jgi:selenocysteine lyase/cysteine desulfurase|nr:aminotransferase class V-fold PLP-dependent enzyme [Gammaproteobacteria bacterium]